MGEISVARSSLSPPLLWLSLRPMLPLMPGMDIMDIPAITDTAVTDTMVDTTVWDTADTTADIGRGKPRLRPNPLPPLRPTPLLMLATDTTVIVMDTTVILIDTTDTDTVMPVLTDTTAVTGGKL